MELQNFGVPTSKASLSLLSTTTASNRTIESMSTGYAVDDEVRAETSPLLPTARPSRGRQVSSSSSIQQDESYRKSYWLGITGIILASIIMTGSIIMIKRASHKPILDTPDFSRLPPPKPGGRNPNYLVSGYQGAVASEVDLCSEVGVDGKFIFNRIQKNYH